MAGGFWSSLMARTTEHRTALSQEECGRRLRGETDGYFAWTGSKPARATVFPGGALLVSNFILANHTPVTVTFTDEAPGTLIRIRTGPLTIPMLIVATLGVLGILGAGLGGGLPLGQIVLMVLTVGGLAFAVVGITALISSGAHDQLRAFVIHTCEASPA